LFKSDSKDINGNTLLEEVCIRLTWHLHNHDMTYVMNMMWGIDYDYDIIWLWCFMHVCDNCH